MKMKTKDMGRVEWIDVAKGIGIICVMFGHLGVEMIDRVVFTFHMPLFFLISGYLLKVDVSLFEYVKQKGKRLLIPYYITGITICLFLLLADVIRKMWDRILPDLWTTFVAILYGSSFKVSEGIEGIGAIWFLWAVFWAMIIVRLLSKYKYSTIYVCVLAVISYISSQYFWLPLSIQPGICAAVFVYLGLRLQKINLNEKFKSKCLLLFSVIIFVIEIVLGIRVDMANNTYVYGFISVMGAIGICYLMIYIANVISLKTFKVKRVLSVFGKYSLYILCFHQIEMRVFPWSIVRLMLEKLEMADRFYLVVICMRIIGCYICTIIFVKILKAISERGTRGQISDKKL